MTDILMKKTEIWTEDHRHRGLYVMTVVLGMADKSDVSTRQRAPSVSIILGCAVPCSVTSDSL